MLTRPSEHVMWRRMAGAAVLALTLAIVAAPAAVTAAQPEQTEAAAQGGGHAPGGEINIQLPDLNQGDFLGMTGHQILLTGLVVCVLGLLFGAWTYVGVKNLPCTGRWPRSPTSSTDLQGLPVQQGKFLLILGCSSARS
jgi:K(+)-stimulated pyrophosphate-energized sodium pump